MNAKIWDNHAVMYEQVVERSTSLWGRDAIVLGQLPSTTTSPPPRFLDIACGPGAHAMEAAALGFDVTATDYSPGMIARLEAKIATSATPLRITPRVVDGQTLEGLEDESFDVVSSIFGTFMFPDRAAGWQSALRVLKTGGRLITTSWDPKSANLQLFRYIHENAVDKPETVNQNAKNPMENATFAPASFQTELEENGFTDVHIYTVGHAMSFKHGRELLEVVLDNAVYQSLTEQKDHDSIVSCLLDFIQLECTPVHPKSEQATTSKIKPSESPIESHPFWNQPFVLPAVARIAVATKSHIN